MELQPSRSDHDHVVMETTSAASEEPEATRRSSPEETERLLEKVEGANGRGEDVLDVIEEARRAQEREPVRFVIEPEDAEAEAALIAEAEQFVAEGVLVEP